MDARPSGCIIASRCVFSLFFGSRSTNEALVTRSPSSFDQPYPLCAASRLRMLSASMRISLPGWCDQMTVSLQHQPGRTATTFPSCPSLHVDDALAATRLQAIGRDRSLLPYPCSDTESIFSESSADTGQTETTYIIRAWLMPRTPRVARPIGRTFFSSKRIADHCVVAMKIAFRAVLSKPRRATGRLVDVDGR